MHAKASAAKATQGCGHVERVGTASYTLKAVVYTFPWGVWLSFLLCHGPINGGCWSDKPRTRRSHPSSYYIETFTNVPIVSGDKVRM